MTYPPAPVTPLVRDRFSSVSVARPIFQVLRDDSQNCTCHVQPDDRVCSGRSAMRVTADDYVDGQVFL